MAQIGIDWGSSGFRAYRFDDSLNLIEQLDAPDGIKFVKNGDFESALFSHIGKWLDAENSILLSGMITSRSGWVETPYVECPAPLTQNLDLAIKLQTSYQESRCELRFLPGLCQRTPSPDVIRGEELQLLGAASNTTTPKEAPSTRKQTNSIQPGRQWMVMPGTHSKWACISEGIVSEFHTIMTGELYEVLLKHSLVGQLAVDKSSAKNPTASSADDESFFLGLDRAYESGNIMSQLFTCRASVLLQSLEATQVKPYLSGLLIGTELREGLDLLSSTDKTDMGKPLKPLTLIGSDMLCERYSTALNRCGVETRLSDTDPTATGYRLLFDAL